MYSPQVPVYPRSRGEHTSPVSGTKRETGLSPLARGTLLFAPAIIDNSRFIPALAGNTYLSLRVQGGRTVYPRSRGEHSRAVLIPMAFSGLSPLARGTPVTVRDTGEFSRFIPARAGNTFKTPHSRPQRSVYPRSRGEHTKNIIL